ncbi:MAG: hypothetical protein H0V70_02695 [Ktedonobacteraceae bacterium]|nr:hypothetical protein [Ktedonobacteraceae bacterium]
MKISIGPITLDIGLFLRLCLPATVFIGLCTGILLAFNPVLLLIDQIAPRAWLWPLIGTAWLLLLILYIMLGIAFTHFVVRRLRASFGAEELRVQRRMALVSGLPFYAICLLCFIATLACILFPDTVNPLSLYVSAAGFLGFALVSGSYLLLVRFLLSRSTTRVAY